MMRTEQREREVTIDYEQKQYDTFGVCVQPA